MEIYASLLGILVGSLIFIGILALWDWIRGV